MCHAPIVVPEVGGAEAHRCGATTRSMREAAERCVASGPDRVVLVSPHSPRHGRDWAAWEGSLRGSLARFRHKRERVDLPPDPAAIRELGVERGLRGELDHGAVVPLLFLTRAGWRGPTVVLAPPSPLGDAEQIGGALAAITGNTALIASGDMSHRLSEEAPAGYDPRARSFDRAFVEALRRGDWQGAIEAPEREIAAEDVIDSTKVAMASIQDPRSSEVLSYEGPWGVGYTVAVLHQAKPPLWAVARGAVGNRIRGDLWRLPDGGPPAQGVFVTIRRQGELRGCTGRMRPDAEFLYHEIAEIAIGSATRDRRFEPVRAWELPELRYEVSMLGDAERVVDSGVIDPKKHGVVVKLGDRRGVLLPALPHVDTAAKAIGLALRKAGIDPAEAYELARFRCRKVVQP